jgi:hypothetical protein
MIADMRARLMTLVCLALLAATSAAMGREATCSIGALAAAAKRVDIARAALSALPVGDGFQTDVSPRARRGIAAMKARLGDFVDASMRCTPQVSDPTAIDRQLSALAHASARADEPPKEAGLYGQELSFAAAKPADQPRLIAITASFQIECGSDAMLFVFAPDHGIWREALRWQNKPYRTIAGAFWSLDYAISPPDRLGRWFVVTKSVSPSCSSTWSTITYTILRPLPHRRGPRALLTGSDSMWCGSEDFGTLTARPTSVDLRFHAASIDSGLHNRVWIRHFTVIGNAVRRVQPVAVSPGDFVDAWIVSSWRDASAWSAKRAAGTLRRSHRRLHKLRYFDYVSIRRCSDGPDHHQIELAHEDDPPYYFHVLGQTTYEMFAVATKPDVACNGENLIENPQSR